MERKPVNSSNIKSVGYDESTGTLQIEFVSGAVWNYENIEKWMYESLISSLSVGKYFSANIRGKFNEIKING